jgi:hypothetical protein
MTVFYEWGPLGVVRPGGPQLGEAEWSRPSDRMSVVAVRTAAAVLIVYL